MAELAENVNATSKYWEVDALPAATEFVQVDSEIVRVQSDFPAGIDQRTQQPRAAKIRVGRGAAGTTAATHTSGATLTPLYGLGGGGGGVTVDNQDDPPAEVSTLIVPGATISGSEADLSAVGGEQMIRLLGPYRVNYNDAGMGVNGAGKVVGDDLPVGSVVLAWATMITAWNNVADVTADGRLTIDFQWEHAGGVGVPGSLGELLFQTKATLGYGEDTSSSGWPVQSYGAHDAISRLSTHYHIISPGVKMLIRVRGTNPGTPTQGVADIYALTAESAA